MAAIEVLIADDHPMIRTAISNVIRREPNMEVIAEAANGQEAVEYYEQLKPDVTLMDISMPVLNGIDAIRRIRSIDPEARVIVLTNFDTDEDVQKGLKVGAMGYLLKDTTPDRLMDTIRKIHAGNKYVPRNLIEKLEQSKDLPRLTAREMDVLELMKRGKSNRAIGVALGITESTVKSHVKNILIKMGVNDRTQSVTRALQRGIISLED